MANPSSKRCKFLAWDAFSNCHTPSEESADSPKRCKLIASSLKDAFADCHTFRARLSSSSPEDNHLPCTDFMDEEEVFISEVISKYMESKTRFTVESFSWALSPETRELFITPKPVQQKSNEIEDLSMQQKSNEIETIDDDFLSARSQLSRCSSVTSIGPFSSARTAFSRSSSLSRIDFQDVQRRRLMMQELSHCQGWPFGLCKKALLLPPLPKSPADSWLWRKPSRVIRTR
ncbi:OLC1v1014241C1 [Oldenlandia corymbosa var. corymbosa]|uniref:OLC1v1014241C1 n=1 Tax=Oldenlandia corymbosa var. corymbosa TaxID=529605 RepID=A0AAV1E3S7_OLDCO|nr:OLC1v1014241C1 [Oldenlandia corymbosa var. corymbosa]